ncbi:GH25 family lysozyme [Rothia terrae]|uniref:lysozyme n=1 Tax=Rothia terrae TaxID=396015 RepID=A0A7H2BC94_9MICC|nr:GH25 family lysozyme [Rothia terrae]QNV37290.1 lysozyme [Rothia terrae]
MQRPLKNSLLTLLVASCTVSSFAGATALPTDTQESSIPDTPQKLSAPPREGDNNPGATMGQSQKQLSDVDHLSPASQEPDQKLAQAAAVSPTGTGILGMDVSGWQPNVNWQAEYNQGARFAYIKATEGTFYRSPVFNSQYTGAADQGMYRGAYHFAIPSDTTGAEQARYFVANGGGWTNDGKTLPGLLDIEHNPYSDLGDMCYDMSPTEMISWISSFVNEYRNLTGRYPALYTTTSWWSECTNNTTAFSHLPLHIASYSGTSSPGRMPAGYSTYDIWQYSASGPFSGDSNVFNGDLKQLADFASNASYKNISTQRLQATTPVQPIYSVAGAIGDHYRATGAQNTYGSPASAEYKTANNGVAQDFSKNKSIYWHPSYGAYSVDWATTIGQRYRATGAEKNWGYPTMDEVPFTNGGKKAWFVQPSTGKNTAVYSSSAFGAHALNGRGAIFNKWADEGGLLTYGYPTTDEADFADGASASFSINNRETVFYWSSQYGAHSMNKRGEIHAKWMTSGNFSGYGKPITDEFPVGNGAAVYFGNGNGRETGVYWSGQSGAHALNSRGALYYYWVRNGYINTLGFPTTDEYRGADGKTHLKFTSGAELTWTEAQGVRHVK